MANVGLVGSLLTNMRAQIDAFGRLYALASDKKDIIVKNDVDALRQMNRDENEVVGRCQRLEKDRGVIMEDIASVLGIKRKGMTVASLLPRIAELPESGQVESTLTELMEILRKIKEANDQNRILVQNALDYIDFSMNVLMSAVGGDGPSFSSPYGDGYSGTGGLFDVRQ